MSDSGPAAQCAGKIGDQGYDGQMETGRHHRCVHSGKDISRRGSEDWPRIGRRRRPPRRRRDARTRRSRRPPAPRNASRPRPRRACGGIHRPATIRRRTAGPCSTSGRTAGRWPVDGRVPTARSAYTPPRRAAADPIRQLRSAGGTTPSGTDCARRRHPRAARRSAGGPRARNRRSRPARPRRPTPRRRRRIRCRRRRSR